MSPPISDNPANYSNIARLSCDFLPWHIFRTISQNRPQKCPVFRRENNWRAIKTSIALVWLGAGDGDEIAVAHAGTERLADDATAVSVRW